MERKELAKYFDHTNLKAYATKEDLYKTCDEAVKEGCAMVAINSFPVKDCADYLKGTSVHVGAAIGFPLGQTTIETKKYETIDAINNGADEIDYVVNVGKVKEHNWDYIKEEMKTMVSVCKEANKIVKVIFENCYLEKDEIIGLCHIAKEVGPDFIKTSTGFGTGGATVEDVLLMKKEVGDVVKIKAAGGIRDLATCMKMIEAGASRIGTSSSTKILDELSSLE